MQKYFLWIILLLSSCSTYQTAYQRLAREGLLVQPLNRWPETQFVHLTDVHIFPAEWASGATYQKYIDDDPKLLKESQEIFLTALEKIKAQRPKFILISGDLTKDGEIASHEWLAQRLEELRIMGISTYVVPGNHDLNNPDAVRYYDNRTERVSTASPEDFAHIYANFGYSTALERDPASLSYLAEPVPGLWLLALDSCVYETNFRDNKPYTGGFLRQQTVSWMEKVLLQAQKQNKAVIAMLHHPPNEQFKNRERYMKDFVLQHHREITQLLSRYGVSLIFSGHTHSQDITVLKYPEGFPVYSVVTGSPVSFPNSYRLVSLTPERATIESYFIKNIPSFQARGISFWDVSRQFGLEGVVKIVTKTLSRFGVGREESDTISQQVAQAFLAFWTGDEKFTGTEKVKSQGLSFMAWVVVSMSRDLVDQLWQDLEPVDNHIIIHSNGEWMPHGLAQAYLP